MFLLHQRTRRSLCRYGFVLFCLAPTCAIALWAGDRNSEAHRAEREAELSRTLRAHVVFDDVAYPEPAGVRYSGLAIADPETRRPIATAPVVEARASAERVTVFASQLTLHSQQLAALGQMLHDRLRAHAQADGRSIRLSAGEVAIASANGDWKLLNAAMRFEPTASGRGCRLTFHPDDKEAPAVAVTLVRSQDATTAFELDTHGASVPLALLFAANGNARPPLSAASFSGFIQMHSSADGWQGMLRGTIAGVDLEREFSSRFAHRLTGTAEIQIRHAAFRAGRLQEVEGRFIARGGAISETLISAAERSLRFRRATRPAETGETIAYDWLAFDFLIDKSGVWIKGCAPFAGSGVALSRQRTALLMEPDGPSGPAALLVRMLVPETNPLVPATQEAEALLCVLPVPQ
jgi:hypothetical protein